MNKEDDITEYKLDNYHNKQISMSKNWYAPLVSDLVSMSIRKTVLDVVYILKKNPVKLIDDINELWPLKYHIKYFLLA
eukprot:snap_masked-scaffold_9-processed-gene-2.49-mRNA-1 protein AED:1.00 eAED:1.00 QI:0/-1/0/0/-1/1/1/0/77